MSSFFIVPIQLCATPTVAHTDHALRQMFVDVPQVGLENSVNIVSYLHLLFNSMLKLLKFTNSHLPTILSTPRNLRWSQRLPMFQRMDW